MRLRLVVLLSIFLAVFSFLLFWYFINTIWPNPDAIFAAPQLLLLLLTCIFLSSVTLPVAAYLNYRFAKPGWEYRDKGRLYRQGAWVGFLGVILAYLQLIRALNWTIALVLICVFILIEVFFLTRE